MHRQIANRFLYKETVKLEMTQKWDKVFPKSDKVEHKKITFHNHFGSQRLLFGASEIVKVFIP
jgi:hypothetical protein